MNTPRTNLLSALIRDSLYVIDEAAIAETILLRARLRRTLPEPALHGDDRSPPRIRSLQRDRNARSFRLERGRINH